MNPHFKHALKQSIPVLIFITAFILLAISFSSCSNYLSFTDKAGTDWHVQGNRIESVDSTGKYVSRKINKAYRRFNHLGAKDQLIVNK